MTKVDPIPEGYPRVTPYLCVDGAAAAIDFYTKVLGATEQMRMPAPEGKIGHAELQLGNSIVMLADEFPDMGVLGPKSVGGTPVTLHVYVDDVDATFDAALAAGASSIRPVEVSTATVSACTAMIDCVTTSSRRLGSRSARTPPKSEKPVSGSIWSALTRPSANEESVSWRTSQA